jgi:hypothetical protein
MSGQGYPHEGNDHRVLGGIWAKIVSAISWDSDKEPPSLILSAIGFKFYFPLCAG